MSSLDSFFATVKLPAMSKVAHQLIRTLNRDDVSVTEVRDIIANDPALIAKLLRLANSAQFGLPRGVHSLEDAIHMVGMAKVRTLSVGACMCESFPILPGLDQETFWQSCMACAGYAQWLSNALEMDAQQAWLTGMMMRLGELLIGQADPRALAEIEKHPHLPADRWHREKHLIGFSEGQITAELARRWNFPLQMVQAFEHCHAPLAGAAFSPLGAVVHLAGILADIPNASTDAMNHLPLDVLEKLKLDAPWIKATLPASNSFISLH